jgi:glutathione synthase/RimK-type ligase-like ATP-grasp enzyme
MEICVIGRKNTDAADQKFIEAAKGIADVVLIPITSLALMNNEDGSSVRYQSRKLSSFDAIIFRVRKEQYNLAYQVANNFAKGAVTIQMPKSFLTASSKSLLFHELAKVSIKVPRTLFSEDKETIEANLNKFRYPVMIKVPTDKKKFMIANSHQEVKSMVDTLKTLGQPIIIEEYYPDAVLFRVFVLGDKVVCTLKINKPDPNYRGGEPKIAKPSKEMVEVALQTAKALKTEIAIIRMVDSKEPRVVDVSVCPYFEDAEKVSGAKFSEKVFQRIKEVVEHPATLVLQ